MIRVGSIVLRVDDLRRQTEFWTAALGYLPRPGGSDDFVLLRPRDGVGPNLSLDRVRSSVQVPPRIHLDLYTEDQGGEVRRLVALGATEVHWDRRPPDADYVILADPEGNRFCVVDVSEPRAARPYVEMGEEEQSMADPFARIKVLGAEVACYLRPGTDCDVAALTRGINEVCVECSSIEELRARMTSVADGHALDVEYHTSPPVPTDPVERLVSIGFLPRAH